MTESTTASILRDAATTLRWGGHTTTAQRCEDRASELERAASPPVPEIESHEAIERGARSIWASFCQFSDSGETCPWDEVPEKERARLRSYYWFAVRAARGVTITAQTAPPVPESPSPEKK